MGARSAPREICLLVHRGGGQLVAVRATRAPYPPRPRQCPVTTGTMEPGRCRRTPQWSPGSPGPAPPARLHMVPAPRRGGGAARRRVPAGPRLPPGVRGAGSAARRTAQPC
eukprot:gene23033-biopygen17778